MPIEFPCSNCHRQLRTPDGSHGKLCRCPACGLDSLIPHPSSVQADSNASGAMRSTPSVKPTNSSVQPPTPSVKPTTPSAATSSAPSGLGARISIRCPECQHELVCSSSLIGSKGQCKQCLHVFVIATDSRAAKPSTGMVFSCPRCGQLFEGNEGMRGRKGKCHQCQEVFFIEPEVVAKPASRPEIPSRSGMPNRTEEAAVKQDLRPVADQPAQPSANRMAKPKTVSTPVQQGFASTATGGPGPMTAAEEGEAPGRLPSGRKASAYFLPGLFLLIVAILALGLGVLTILIQVQQGFGSAGMAAGLVLSLVMLMLPTIALMGGVGLLMRRRRVMVVACLCSCFVPCSFAVLGIPFAIWGMIMAGSTRAIRDFRS